MDALLIGRVIGVEGEDVEFVLTTEQKEFEHDGRTYNVGQIGTYVTIPGRQRTLIGFVTGVAVRDSEVDQKREQVVRVQLLGTIVGDSFSRGVVGYPTIGEPVCLAVQSDFETIFGYVNRLVGDADASAPAAGDGPRERRSFTIGKFALDPTFEVKVLGNEFLSRHVAILGNSGSGKSCTTTRVLEEILTLPGAQVVMFDLHGEYATAFADARGRSDANVAVIGHEDLVVPYWLLKFEEFETLFVDRSNSQLVSNQISFLKESLTRLRGETAEMMGIENEFSIDTPIYFDLDRMKIFAENLNDARFILETNQYAFVKLPLRSMSVEEQEELITRQRCQFNKGKPEGEVPHAMYHGKLHGLLELLESRLNDHRYDFLLRPVEQARRSRHFKGMMPDSADPADMSNFMGELIRLFTGQTAARKNLVILDLSGIPQEIVNVTVAAVSRLLFDYNFWCPPETRQPLLLVFEEAHNYIPRHAHVQPFARLAVEKIAKEGRKYGVAAMVITQRPSELSETVLSQCNNMVVLRMSNPDDQLYVQKVVGDQFAGLISMLPSLQPGEGFVVGDSVIMPMRTYIERPSRMPRSGNMPFFGVWSGFEHRDMPDVEGVLMHWWKQDRSHLMVGRYEDEDVEPPRSARTMNVNIPQPSSEYLPRLTPKVAPLHSR